MEQQDQRSVGVGEVSSGPALAAIGNAVAHALGARLRDLPFTRERIAHALLS
jgi:CO/xanthine dehydrogenase Mo-binding subunit